VAAALTISACGSSDPQQLNQDTPIQSEGQRALHQLNETDRAIGLKRAIHASGFQCQRIDRSAFVRKYGTLEMWAAACNDGRGWGLFVGRDESVQVRPCKDMPTLKLPRCPDWAENPKVTR
jgi:hypothetical protein